jgi:hypothetical protein
MVASASQGKQLPHIQSRTNRSSLQNHEYHMTVYRRRLASSFEALKRTLNGRLMRAGDETSDEVMSGEEVACLVAGCA